LRRYRSAPMMALALAAAGSGVWLSISPRSFEAGVDAVGVHVDGVVLTPVAQSAAGTKVFTGAATLVIMFASPGIVRAGAVTTWNGVLTTGRCVLIGSAAGASETCQYDLGTALLTSTDAFVSRTRTWHRRYSDRGEITITVPAGSALIPIPFPLGR